MDTQHWARNNTDSKLVISGGDFTEIIMHSSISFMYGIHPQSYIEETNVQLPMRKI